MIQTKDLEFLGTLDTGVYFELHCPKCKQKIEVSQSGRKEKCKCGYVWYLEFIATGKRELA